MTSLPLIVIRPEPGNTGTLAAAKAMTLAAHGFPLFDVAPRAWDMPERPFTAILAGSANVFRHGGPQLDALRQIPVAAVGETTAQFARGAGFTVNRTGEGGLQPLVETLSPGRYLRLAGLDRVELVPPDGVQIETRTVYAAQPCPVPGELAALLSGRAVTLLHSGEAARHFRAECERLEIVRSNIYLACLAPRIGELAGPGWGQIAVARTRTDADLLELAARMCQTV
ncbi:uroporphyrinogen-III synthase [Novosphingobium sp. MMS21-SN21R]|uniref:uroporphyrinogen-III synthase n=1 Tax=Novosphingobium sp. MMS21-SN21R TaxID=2969298 RepID=UPI002886C4A8|nr:uroporphyrinogen-III synthase [Novosphingobium sp. MMS21-SN21R]MDT0509037.1 uroporphyrinogen-III synthase [Novosphingobium sp. MMS21-SN21R]